MDLGEKGLHIRSRLPVVHAYNAEIKVRIATERILVEIESSFNATFNINNFSIIIIF